MKNKIYSKRMNSVLRHGLLVCTCVAALVLFFASPGTALEETQLFGNPLTVSGFINQGAGYGIAGDHFDTKEGWQSFYFDLLLETKYVVNPDFSMFVSGILSGDWAYEILSDNDEWNAKGFNKSRDNLAYDTEPRDLIQECHFTWAPGNFLFRVGKQIVVWGETDSVRLMDQINPLDQSRGITDVEFESTIVPIWLVRSEYFFEPDSNWLQDLGLEIIFNPNADFVADKGPAPGNDFAGIWGADVQIPLGGPFPMDFAHLGSLRTDLEHPDSFDPDYFEYGLRLKAVVNDTIMTFNYFYGRDNSPVAKMTGAPPAMTPSEYDGRLIFNIDYEGYYPLFRMAGFTIARDFENLNISALGGVAPIFRVEAFYAFDNTFAGAAGFEEHDEYRYAVNAEWKIKVSSLNPRAYFTILAQFDNRHIMDYPSSGGLNSTTGAVEDDNYRGFALLKTTYFHNKLEPQIVWIEDFTNESTTNILQLKYEYNDSWDFTLGTVLINGRKVGAGYQPLENKDHIFFTASYQF